MRRIRNKKYKKKNAIALNYSGDFDKEVSDMQLYVYNFDQVVFTPNFSFDNWQTATKKDQVNWLNFSGLTNKDAIIQIGEELNIPPSILSDIVSISRSAHFDDLDDSLFFSVKSILPTTEHNAISVEQISFLLKDGILVSFQEKKADYFDYIRERIDTKVGLVRKKKADYLLYLLLDAIIENYFITIDAKEDSIEALMLQSKTSDDPTVMQQIEALREVFHFLKRSVTPLRDAIFTLINLKEDEDFTLIEDGNFHYFSRLLHKTNELLEQIEYDKSSLESASNFFYTAQAHKMNQIMKVLTVVSAIFMPLTFIAGLYGMNFDNIPELHYQNGYFALLAVMFLILLLMIYYFKKKKWF